MLIILLHHFDDKKADTDLELVDEPAEGGDVAVLGLDQGVDDAPPLYLLSLEAAGGFLAF